jgi:acetoin utilization deacetylase AcuC-like enzyme
VELEESGRADKVGSGEAVGFNVNVPLYSEDGLGDADYMQVGLLTKAQKPLGIQIVYTPAQYTF